MDTIGKRIKYIREEIEGLNQEEFGKRIGGYTKGHISNVENGTDKAGDKLLGNIEREFYISVEWIKTGKRPMKIEKPEIKDAESEEDEFLKELTIDDRDLFEGVVKEFKDLTAKDKENIREVIRLAKKQIERFKKEEEEE